MSDLEDYRSVLGAILIEWDHAEEDIKQAEQVCQRVSEPSIKELRYAGRRVTEALHLILGAGDSARIGKLLADADFDCHRARHDAIDAASSKITADITAMVKSLGHDVVLRAYPKFPDFYRNLQKLRRKIVESRKNRENRDAIYESIENVDLPSLVADFEDIKASEDMMRSLAKQERRHKALVIALLIVEVVVILGNFRGTIQNWLSGVASLVLGRTTY